MQRWLRDRTAPDRHWYLDQEDWWRDVTSGAYRAWIDKNYGFRIAV